MLQGLMRKNELHNEIQFIPTTTHTVLDDEKNSPTMVQGKERREKKKKPMYILKDGRKKT